jgi:hypothetical protein
VALASAVRDAVTRVGTEVRILTTPADLTHSYLPIGTRRDGARSGSPIGTLRGCQGSVLVRRSGFGSRVTRASGLGGVDAVGSTAGVGEGAVFS